MTGDSPIPEGSSRAPQKKLTAADKEKLRGLFARADCQKPDGSADIALIARLSGLNYGQVYAFATRDAFQRTRRPEADTGKLVPNEAGMIEANDASGTPPGVTITHEQFSEIQSVLRQQKRMVAKDWEALGMTEDMAERVEKLTKMGKAPMIHVVGMLYGGLIKHATMLDEILETDAKKIRENSLPQELDKEGMPVDDGKVQREWRYTWYAGAKLNLDIYNSLHKTQAILARVMRDMKDLGVKKPDEKGVFEMPAVAERRPDGE